MKTSCIKVNQDVPSQHLCQDTYNLAPMMEEFVRVGYQLYFEFKQGMIAILARASLQEQHRRIVARMAAECKGLTEILNQHWFQNEVPINQGSRKRPLETLAEDVLRKRTRLGKVSIIPTTTAPPSKGCQRCYQCGSRAHMMRGCTIPETSILCQCYWIIGHRT
ncbi:hypothetical protein NE237_009656 [Protea cynaroides]|uniref:CCHC-type domain-containing protein n=1 Tax=Protea cynaroides TaxID=273540 RepID=A0A9Q0KZ20_9MAGN|nr:hypothetical protein NE237_009656 [Protea cynaroides]